MNLIKKVVKKTETAVKSGNLGSFLRPSFCDDESGGGGGGVVMSPDVFLHGHLFLQIRAARNLPDMESWIAKLYDSKDVTDPFVDVFLGKANIAKTSVILNDMNPVWNESYRIEVINTF